MSDTGRQRSHILPFVILLAVLLIPISITIVARVRHGQRTRVLELAQEAFLEDVRQLGGQIVLAPAGPSDVVKPMIAVDLSKATITGEVIDRLADFTTIQRLNLDGATLDREHYLALGRLTNLRNLSLNESTFADDDLRLSALRLAALSIRGTAITDEGLSRLSGMTTLKSLNIFDTAVTAEGLKSLAGLASLTALEIDSDCITPDNAIALQSLKSLQILDIHVTNGLGRQTRDLLSPLSESCAVQAQDPFGRILWDAHAPWEETLAGVVEIVTEEVDLDPQQATQLIEAIGEAHFARPQKVVFPASTERREVRGEPIKSVDEFLIRLREPGYAAYEVRAFARDSFTKADISKLLEAFRAEPDLRTAEYLNRFGSYLLVRDGWEDPENATELERMLNHEDPEVRGRTVYAFDRYGHPFNEDWAPSEAAVAFGLPRLIQLAEDPELSVQLAVTEVLGDLVHHHPSRAAEVMPVLVGMLEKRQFGYTVHAIGRVVKANPEAANASVPRLRRLLADIEKNTDPSGNRLNTDSASAVNSQHSYVLGVLVDVVTANSELSHEVVVESLQRLRDGEHVGRHLDELVSPGSSKTVRLLVHELLDLSAGDNQTVAEHARSTLASVARAMRDYRVAQGLSPAPAADCPVPC
ncbi:MAG: hypothetical protein O3C40_11425 [Planctomycetota bacterium]|nr:hypothetical protein [Planctomycetota bacterium]